MKTLGYKNASDTDTNNATGRLALLRHGKVSQFGVAENLRQQVMLRNGVPKAQALENVVEHLELQGQSLAQSKIIVERVAELLIDCGDIGQASAFGQVFLLPVQRRNVLLPSGEIISLGGSDISARVPDDRLAIFAEAIDTQNVPELDARRELGRVTTDLNSNGSALFLSPSSSGLQNHEAWERVLESFKNYQTTGQGKVSSLPSQIRKAIALCGTIDVEFQQWTLGEESLDFLKFWLGIAPIETVADDAQDYITEQLEIVNAPASDRILVEAGPGSGKTHVAIGRIARLLGERVPPSKIWLLSFTRVAVEEMRRRISEHIGANSAQSLNVATFDSFAWKLDRFFGIPELSTSGFDETMKASIRTLMTRDTALQDALKGIEHVIIDEAQDLVGSRREMVGLFLERISDSCGVTILGDFAQSIYGWQAERAPRREAALQEVSAYRPDQKFRQARLQQDHRTKSSKLTRMFRNARELLRDRSLTPPERYEGVRKLIEDAAENSSGTAIEKIMTLNGRALVLFRGRRALMSMSHSLANEGIPLRIKLSNRSAVVAPWIGAIFADVDPNTRVTRHEFQTLWEDAGINPLALDIAKGWDEIRALSGDTGASISIKALCSRIDQDIPVRFLSDHLGTRGPTFSTIHGAKGKEADKVFMLLPPQPDLDDQKIDWDEEARILYVGATRARRKLFVGSRRAGYMHPTSNGRMWRGSPNDFSVEIGMPEDTVFAQGKAASFSSRTANRFLVEINGIPMSCTAERAPGEARYTIIASGRTGAPVPLGYLTDRFIEEVCEIADCSRQELPDQFGGFFIVGGSTAVAKDRTVSERLLGLGLNPILMGFAQIRIGELNER